MKLLECLSVSVCLSVCLFSKHLANPEGFPVPKVIHTVLFTGMRMHALHWNIFRFNTVHRCIRYSIYILIYKNHTCLHNLKRSFICVTDIWIHPGQPSTPQVVLSTTYFGYFLFYLCHTKGLGYQMDYFPFSLLSTSFPGLMAHVSKWFTVNWILTNHKITL